MCTLSPPLGSSSLFLSLLTVVYVCLFLYLTGCVTLISLEWFVLLYLQMNVLGMQWWIIDKELCWNVSEVICDVEGGKKIPHCFTVHSSWSDRCSLNSYVCRFFKCKLWKSFLLEVDQIHWILWYSVTNVH